jgi:tRNA threonylcarbamoyladenosine biosynthesis protein TsaB
LLILGIDTTEKNIHIALSKENSILAEIEESSNKTEEIINYVDKLFKAADKKAEQLSAIGVITGPGGYTGTRAGVSVAKTLAQFLDIPLFGFNKLEAILIANSGTGLTAAAIDIKKGEVYACLGSLENGEIHYEVVPAVYSYETWQELLKQQDKNITLLAAEFKNKIEIFDSIPENIQINSQFYLKPSHITRITKNMIEEGRVSSFRDVSPFYIREAV